MKVTDQAAPAGMLFGWEIVMTFVLVSVVYAVAVGEPSFGNIGPFAVGLSLFAMVFAGEWNTLTRKHTVLPQRPVVRLKLSTHLWLCECRLISVMSSTLGLLAVLPQPSTPPPPRRPASNMSARPLNVCDVQHLHCCA